MSTVGGADRRDEKAEGSEKLEKPEGIDMFGGRGLMALFLALFEFLLWNELLLLASVIETSLFDFLLSDNLSVTTTFPAPGLFGAGELEALPFLT